MYFKKIALCLCLLLSISCTEDLDFKQTEDFSSQPSFSLSLVNFNIPPTVFVNIPGAPPVTEINERSNLGLFQDEFIQKNLVKIDFNFEVENSFDKDFTVEISLINGNDVLVQRLNDIIIPRNNNEVVLTETLLVADNPAIRNIETAIVSIKLSNTNTTILSTDVGALNFKSAVTIHLDTSR